ncbi:hypothetical protein CEXT_637981 [Caerostris extrusa]|uniref:Uncharacterized protein n=1 Tax=Caerostris extrusa TaxID=172846 RepID=A0AAV4TMF1_CAEEX|nr:hypothetical protein CEXT_637981 [Caerostris extrusa]
MRSAGCSLWSRIDSNPFPVPIPVAHSRNKSVRTSPVSGTTSKFQRFYTPDEPFASPLVFALTTMWRKKIKCFSFPFLCFVRENTVQKNWIRIP